MKKAFNIGMNIIFMLLVSCADKQGGSEDKKNATLEMGKREAVDKKRYYNALYEKVPEIKKKAKEVQDLSNGKVHLGVMIDFGSTDGKYFTAKVYEDHTSHIVTIWDFYINIRTLNIMYYDVVEDKLVSLQEWRKAS